VTIGFIVLLLERALVQLFQTEGAHKMFRMEFLEHGRDATPGDGLRAASAQGTTFGVIVGLAVRETFMVEK
jgi:hypothetical protein